MPEGMTLLDVVNKDQVPLPTDSEAIAMKMIATADCLKSRTPKAVQDFDDAMKIFGKLYHEDGYISYKDEVEKTVVKMAFNSFFPRYKEAKEEAGEKEGEGFWAEEQWKVFLKIEVRPLLSLLFRTYHLRIFFIYRFEVVESSTSVRLILLLLPLHRTYCLH
jgi:hypothetical protein